MRARPTTSVTAPPSGADVATGGPGCEGAPAKELATIVAATNRISQLDGSNDITRKAVEFARDTLGIERVGLFLVQVTRRQIVLRGTWGTNDRGRTADERAIAHSCSEEDFEALRAMHEQGVLWQYHSIGSNASHRQRVESRFEDRDWVAVTPLVVGPEVVGLMYNDTAISRTPFDWERQTRLALFASLLAGLTRDRLTEPETDTERTRAAAKPCRFIQKVMTGLQREPSLTGKALAQRFGITPGHLATTFKAEAGGFDCRVPQSLAARTVLRRSAPRRAQFTRSRTRSRLR
jgi:hypothetical protein